MKTALIIFTLIGVGQIAFAETYKCDAPYSDENGYLPGSAQYQVITDADSGVILAKNGVSKTLKRTSDIQFGSGNTWVDITNSMESGVVETKVSLSVVYNNDLYQADCK
jgi:hypothetical protein